MALIRSFLIRRIRMSEIDSYAFRFHLREVSKFRSVVSGNAFEYFIVFVAKLIDQCG